jgi:hypothetical protein
VVFLAVKPQQAQAACQEIAGHVRADAVLVSIVAGLPAASLAAMAGVPRVIRVMPNTPCLVGHGVSVVCQTADVSTAAAARVRELLGAVGQVHEADESQINAVTGLSGSGPGFVALLVEALADGGVLVYETFAHGQHLIGRPSRPDFLLQPGELLQAFAGMHVVAYEDGLERDPPRRVQRLVALAGSHVGPPLQADAQRPAQGAAGTAG